MEFGEATKSKLELMRKEVDEQASLLQDLYSARIQISEYKITEFSGEANDCRLEVRILPFGFAIYGTKLFLGLIPYSSVYFHYVASKKQFDFNGNSPEVCIEIAEALRTILSR